MSEAYPYVYWWNREGRKGQLCRITVRAKRNTILVEFEDGFTMVTSRWAARKIKVNDDAARAKKPAQTAGS